mmetsp:Transcript_28769/g.88211  ORF Transcript_28769/g.88211 Transcript_28769/m.88211 type:complete len:294 (+) Transcript_28769:147-1028(+)|eukprot:scaffold319069_cov27-Tisochrysis_lutea.AAC.1
MFLFAVQRRRPSAGDVGDRLEALLQLRVVGLMKPWRSCKSAGTLRIRSARRQTRRAIVLTQRSILLDCVLFAATEALGAFERLVTRSRPTGLALLLEMHAVIRVRAFHHDSPTEFVLVDAPRDVQAVTLWGKFGARSTAAIIARRCLPWRWKQLFLDRHDKQALLRPTGLFGRHHHLGNERQALLAVMQVALAKNGTLLQLEIRAASHFPAHFHELRLLPSFVTLILFEHIVELIGAQCSKEGGRDGSKDFRVVPVLLGSVQHDVGKRLQLLDEVLNVKLCGVQVLVKSAGSD